MIRNCQYSSIFTHRHRLVLLWKAGHTVLYRTENQSMVSLRHMMDYDNYAYDDDSVDKDTHDSTQHLSSCLLIAKAHIKTWLSYAWGIVRLPDPVTTGTQGSSQWNGNPAISKRTKGCPARHTSPAFNSITGSTTSLYGWCRNKKPRETQPLPLKSLLSWLLHKQTLARHWRERLSDAGSEGKTCFTVGIYTPL